MFTVPEAPSTADPLRLHSTLQDVLDDVVPALADYVFVHMQEHQGGAREVAAAHAEPDREARLIHLLHRVRAKITGPDHPVGQALSEGSPVRVEGPAAGRVMRELSTDRAVRSDLADYAPHSFVTLPLELGGEVFGCLSLARVEVELRFTDRELTFLEPLARTLALAISNAIEVERLFAGRMGPPGSLNPSVSGSGRLELHGPAGSLHAVRKLVAGVGEGLEVTLDAVRKEVSRMLLDPSLPEPLRKNVRQMLETVIETDGLVGRLREFSRDDESVLHPVDLNAAVVRPVERITERIGPTLDVEMHLTEASPLVPGVPEVLEHAVAGLLINAVERTPEGGSVTVRTSTEEPCPEDAGRRERRIDPGNYACVSVRGSGPTMSPEVLDDAPDPSLVDRDAPRHPGLGVTIASGVATLLGGHLGLEASESGGWTYKLYLPGITRDEDSTEGGEDPVARPVVLVVDSPEGTLSDAVKILREREYDVVRVEAPSEAMDVWRSHGRRIALVLLDADLAALSLVERLRKICSEDLPVIFTSRALGVEEALQSVSGPRTLFLRSPISADRLMTAAERLMPAGSLT